MAVLARVFVVLFSFHIACVAAALTLTFALMVPGWTEFFDEAASQRATALVVGMSAIVISIGALLPAMLVIVLAEGFRWRSIFFYALAGAALGLIGTLGPDQLLAPVESDFSVHMREIMVGAGIVGGFVYWALAGRNAGLWRKRRAQAGPPARSIGAPE